MASNIPVIVQGNSFSLAIPLQIYYINGDQMDLEDYTPDPTDEVSVQLKGSRRNYTYTPTIDGNVANIDLSGNELADNYSVVVSIVKANGQRLRSFRTDQFFIVESSDDLTPSDIIEGLEENVIYLNSSIFVAGEDGRGIESIVKTGTSGLVDTYTITYSDNTTSTFDVTNGAQGEQGVGIATIAKTSTSGKTDTYTITLTNGQTSTFEVTNGLDGVDLGLANIVDDLTTGGSTNVLSAEQGVELKGMIDNIDSTLKSGTYAEALDAVLAYNSVFEFLLVDEVDNSDLIKPLWHINGSLVDAAGAVVSLATLTAPVFSRDSGDVTPGTTLTITCPSGNTLHYSVNGVVDTSTSDVTITINEASVVKAYIKSGDAVSDIVAKSYGIAIDHKFQFKIKLTGDNSTEYVPVVAVGSPIYTMTVDWGDGSTPREYTNKYFAAKGCGHTYSGTAGDEFVITLRGTAIPYLSFSASGLTNILALVAILENTLECKTHFSKSNETRIDMNWCSSLNYLSADAFSNSNNNGLRLMGCSSLTSLEDGFFTNLISGGTIETCNEMFMNTPISITASQMSELKSRLSQCAVFSSMFYGVKNYIEIPNDFFDNVEVEITSVYAFTHTSGNQVTGDAKALYDALQSKVSSNVSKQYAFTGRGLSNRNQVPSAWGGTGS